MTTAYASIGLDAKAAQDKLEKDGYLLYPEVLDADLIKEASNHVEWLQEQHPDLRPEALHSSLVRDDPFWVRLVSDPRLLDIAQQFIGPNIALFASHYISKPPYDGQPVLWHQDGSYWPLEPMEVVTLWLAVDDSVPENGCLRVIPGTHKMDLKEMKANTAVVNVLGSSIDDNLVDESKAVDCILKAGGVEVHHPNIIHGSNANNSPMRRCGLTIRYIPTSTLVTKPDAGALFLLRGNAVPGINEYLPMPKFDPARHMPFRDSSKFV
jgi:ectoine hydroxylase-related dioxygenase (phytanoyl-CoA dioxygenase family)